jgi:hypothetical protein
MKEWGVIKALQGGGVTQLFHLISAQNPSMLDDSSKPKRTIE